MGTQWNPPIGANVACSACVEPPVRCRVDMERSPIQEYVPLSSFHADLRRRISSIPLGYAEEAIREACIRFATDSLFLRRWIIMDLQRGVADYYPMLNGEESTIQPLTVGIRRHHLGTFMEFDLRNKMRRGDHQLCRIGNATAWFRPPGTLLLSVVPECDQPDAFCVEVAARPSEFACQVDAEFKARYGQAVINQALSQLYLEKSREWFDPGLAKKHEQLYNLDLATAKGDIFESVRGTNPQIYAVKRH